MEPSCIHQTLIPGTSRLFSDFLYAFDRVAKFYGPHFADLGGIADLARNLQFPAERRAQIVEALGAQNNDGPALRALAEPDTVAVVTGQQAGLLSGPAYTIIKALTAVRLAQELTQRGVRAVPVFWIATEDHDVAEVDHAWLYNEESKPARVAVKSSALQNLPVGTVPIDDLAMESVRAGLGELPFAVETIALVERHYGGSTNFARSFRGFLQEILRDFDLLYLDPLNPATRAVAAPILEKAARSASEIAAAVRERDQELQAAGYHTQVHVDASASLLFFLEGGRRTPLRIRDGVLSAKDFTLQPEDLQARAEQISPNALLRPVMQDFMLPTAAYVAGPAEIAYFAQSEVLYRSLLGRMPVIFPRNSMTILDARADKLLQRFGLSAEQVLAPKEQVRSTVAQRTLPLQLRSDMDAFASSAAGNIEGMRTKLLAFDPTLAAAADKSLRKIRYQAEKLHAKTARELMRREEHVSRDVDYVINKIYPQRHLQERFYSVVPLLAEHGLDLPARLYEHIQLTCPDHMVRTL